MIREILREEIEKAVEKLYGKKVDFDVLGGGRFGDYSSNVAMLISNMTFLFKEHGSPREVAEKVKEELLKSKNFTEYVSKIEIASQGFLNFYLSEKGLEEGLKFALKDKFDFGEEKIQVEFISANPTGELHIGHGRGAFFGDALSNILNKAGYDVKREYYVNDAKASTQIRELGKTVLGGGTSYLTENLKSQISNLKNKIKKTKNENDAGYLVALEIQKDIKKFIEKDLKIKFDKWFSEEKELYGKKLPEKTLELLKKKNFVCEKDGALWFKTSVYGDDEDRVLVRSDKVPSYFLTDIAYHIDKIGRGFQKLIDIWGADHQSHVKRILAAKKALEWKCDLDILVSQLVTIKEGGEAKKLSKRKGEVILLKDLFKEVGLDVLRWFFLEKSLSTHMDFDLDLAKERSKKNPVYYVQYSHARACSILNKSQIPKSKFQINFKLEILNSKQERNLILKLIQFPEVVEDIAKDYQAHRLTTYAYELAKFFTDFYENVRVINAEIEELKKSRLALVFIARKTLEETLSLMGISAPERM